MTTFTTDDRKEAEKEPVPFFGWVEKEDNEKINTKQKEIDSLNVELTKTRKETNV